MRFTQISNQKYFFLINKEIKKKNKHWADRHAALLAEKRQ